MASISFFCSSLSAEEFVITPSPLKRVFEKIAKLSAVSAIEISSVVFPKFFKISVADL